MAWKDAEGRSERLFGAYRGAKHSAVAAPAACYGGGGGELDSLSRVWREALLPGEALFNSGATSRVWGVATCN